MRFLACSGSCVQVGDAAVAAGGLVVVGFGVVKRKIRWRFQVGSDVVPMRLVCNGGGGMGRGAERRDEECLLLVVVVVVVCVCRGGRK